MKTGLLEVQVTRMRSPAAGMVMRRIAVKKNGGWQRRPTKNVVLGGAGPNGRAYHGLGLRWKSVYLEENERGLR